MRSRIYPRVSCLAALLGATALLSVSLPMAAQKAEHKAVSGSPQVQHVIVRGSGDAMEVEIQTSGSQVAPETQAITGPDRIVVDFPGALPAAELRALKVNRGALKAVRSGLFFSNPPITRIVLDLSAPQSYQISTIPNAIVVKLGSPKSAAAITGGGGAPVFLPTASAAKLHTASLNSTSLTRTNSAAPISAAVETAAPAAEAAEPTPPKPSVTVTFSNGMLRIHAEKATLAQVLFEVQRQTQAEIAIPAGAEQEEVVADLGPAPARDVLASLLNGSPYNFIFMGDELTLQKVVLTRRDSSLY
jgi:hypothetical protein